jgi:aspartyl-tRNA(Asn)/glutamyl-tRNA(Gln) amidotransferase subunit A
MNEELHLLTIAEASMKIRQGRLSPVDLTRAYLDRIERYNGVVNAYIEIFADQAMAAARQAEADIKAGRWIGPMHGIPVALKDNIYSVEGPTTCHSRLLEGNNPGVDAGVVTRLRAAGAIILGKLSMWEFATGGNTALDEWPAARNPWNLARSANGSSSGSAVAVAAGLCAGAIGTDTGGSIRNPAAWCGVSGLKPTYGLVSRAGAVPVSFSLDHVGPIAWTSEDSLLMLQVIAGTDDDDPSSTEETLVEPMALADVRIGVVSHYLTDGAGVTPPVSRAFEAVLSALSGKVASIEDVTLPAMRLYQDVGLQIARAEAFAVHEPTLVSSPELYGPAARRRLMMGAVVRGSDYVNAQRERLKLTQGMARLMTDVDILLLPATRFGACDFGEDVLGAKGAFFGRPFNVTGYPAAVAPAGMDDHGMPLAVQIAGRPFEDRLVAAVGSAIEAELGFRHLRPSFEISASVSAAALAS